MRARRTARRPLPRPGEVRGPEDALAVIHAALADEGGILALVLDRAGGEGFVVAVDGAPDGDLERALALLLDGLSDSSSFTEVVLATTRPGPCNEASLDDAYRWFALDARAAEAGVVVLDWFILAGDLARSMAETTFSDDRWGGRSP